MRRTAHLRAFTLVEILMVVVILGIAAAVVIPQIGGRDDMRVSAAARLLMSDLIYAQNNAIATQRPHYLQFTTSGTQSYRMVTAVPATNASDTVAHPVYKSPFVVNFGTGGSRGLEGVQIDTASFDGQVTLGFDALGAPLACTSTGASTALVDGRIVLRAGNETLTISVEPITGEITVQ